MYRARRRIMVTVEGLKAAPYQEIDPNYGRLGNLQPQLKVDCC